MLDEMTWRNASKFAIFLEYENPKLLFPFFILCNLIFLPNECPGLYQHGPGHSLGEKNKVARNEKQNKKKHLGFHIQKIWQILKRFARLFHQA